ncbi:hypothetical protein MMA231_02517 [Asticcacaulis sp. MM231]|uniref:hypothetical protein n=1 Tax=Asticcacaulis sp. MM231 TaxID=3157666 RepID=UPI0032D5A5F6
MKKPPVNENEAIPSHDSNVVALIDVRDQQIAQAKEAMRKMIRELARQAAFEDHQAAMRRRT